MSIYSIGAGFVGGAAVAGYLAWTLAAGHYSAQLLSTQHQLDVSKSNVAALTTAVNSRNTQINLEHTAYLKARALADKLQASANHNAAVANGKAKTLLVFTPGDNYALSSLDVVAESLK